MSHERKALERTFKGVLQTVRCARYPPVQQHYTYRGMMRLNRSVYQNCRGRATTRAPLRSRTGFAPCNHSSGTWQCLPACLHKLIKTSARPLPLPRTILHEFASTPQRSQCTVAHIARSAQIQRKQPGPWPVGMSQKSIVTRSLSILTSNEFTTDSKKA